MINDLKAVDHLATQRGSGLPLARTAFAIRLWAEAQHMLSQDLAALMSLYPPRD